LYSHSLDQSIEGVLIHITDELHGKGRLWQGASAFETVQLPVLVQSCLIDPLRLRIRRRKRLLPSLALVLLPLLRLSLRQQLRGHGQSQKQFGVSIATGNPTTIV
jgi:hypothetical protein